MSGAAHLFPSAMQNLAGGTGSGAGENWNNTDNLQVGLISSTSPAYTWNTTSQGHATVTNFLAGSGAGALTEVSTSSTGYSRTTLTGVSVSTTGLVTTLTCSNIVWNATASWGATYAFFYDNKVATSDSTRELIAYWDFGGTVSTVNGGTFTLTINASGIVTVTSS